MSKEPLRLLSLILTPFPFILSFLVVCLVIFPSPRSVPVTIKPMGYLTKEKLVYKAYSPYPKVLVFVADLNNRGKGKLLSLDTKIGQIDGEFKAVSGVGGGEGQLNAGPIPSVNRINIKHYTVNLKPLYLAKKGIEGNFYQINPHLVKIAGNTRGDFGVHFDANVPGTAGCLGIATPQDWKRFQQLMAIYQRAGLKTMPLIVAYYSSVP